MTPEQLHEGFKRQRRNLIAGSLVLLFYEAAELHFPSFNLLGNTITLQNPAAVRIALWVAYLYWVIRYSGHFNAIGVKGIVQNYRSRLNVGLSQAAKKIIESDSALLSQINKMLEQLPDHSPDCEWKLTPDSARHNWRQSDITVYVHRMRTNDRWSWYSAGRFEQPIQITGLTLIAARWRAGKYMLFDTPEFFEYGLPWIVAASPVVYGFYELAVWLLPKITG